MPYFLTACFRQNIFKNVFTKIDLISQNSSGFKPGNSCTNHLLSITHQIYKSFDDGHEVWSVFLDMWKAFNKLWHKGLIFKLKQNGISGTLLSTSIDFLKLRKQRVVLNGQLSSWFNIKTGIPQGSILSPLLFLIYINELSDGLNKCQAICRRCFTFFCSWWFKSVSH